MRAAPALLAVAALVFPLAACAAPPATRTAEPAVLAAAVAERADAAALERALELADLAPLALPPPRAASDPESADYWRAAAYAFAAEPVAARRDLSMALLHQGRAGWPLPLQLAIEQNGFERPERETEVALGFDLLGILGIGRAAAARALANVEVREALARLEAALWASGFRVERARLDLAAAVATESALQQVLAAALSGERRAELLLQRGWLGELQVAPARAVLAELRTRLSDLAHDVARRRADLAEAAGLPIEAPALDSVGPRAFDTVDPHGVAPAQPSAAELLERHPELRRLRLRYAVAEALVRQAAALAWPELSIGPKAILRADGILPGGVLDVAAAFPGTVAHEVALAAEERERAREELEAALVVRTADLAAKAERWRRDLHTFLHEGPALDAATAGSSRAAEARFLVEARGIAEWTMELERRRRAVEEVIAHALHVRVAALDLAEARGAEALPPLAVASAGETSAREGAR